LEQQREDQKAAKRKAEQERISKLSAAEQQKVSFFFCQFMVIHQVL